MLKNQERKNIMVLTIVMMKLHSNAGWHNLQLVLPADVIPNIFIKVFF